MITYCPKCHREVYRMVRNGETIKISQGNRTIFNVNDKSSLDVSLSCPTGHYVSLKLMPAEGEKDA